MPTLSSKPFMPTLVRIIALLLLMLCVVCLQIAYDATATAPAGAEGSIITPEFVRIADMGFHGTVASFLWIKTLPEVLDLFYNGHTEYFSDMKFMDGVDPRFGYPYAFSVLTIPVVKPLANRDAIALAIGRLGLANADPDWRIPYYMGADYFLDLKDEKDAIYYYDIAARTPGVPEYAKAFALNFGAIPDERQKSEALWATIRDSATDAFTKQRAELYIAHYQLFDYLQAAVDQYKRQYGSYPKTLGDVVQKGIIPSIPPDPFGFSFIIDPGGIVGIDQTKLPK